MNEKTLILCEDDFKEKFLNQFDNVEIGIKAWDKIGKPEEYPCVVVKSCGKYMFVYLHDIQPIIDTTQY